MVETGALLDERNTTHGSFAENARVSQGLKKFLHELPGWALLTEVQRESVDMICLKLSRIMSGHASFADHFVDIAGYATLAAQEIERANDSA